MPSTATITSFFNFVAGTKARANQVTNNFDVFRGHIIPVAANTATAITNTFDLGSTEYQWRTLYLQSLPFINGSPLGAKENVETVFGGVQSPEFDEQISGLTRFFFQPTIDQDVVFDFSVNPNYTPGNQIGLEIYGYHDDSGPSDVVFEGLFSLYKPTATTFANTSTAADQRTATITATVATAAGKFFKNTSMILSDTSGSINGSSIASGDIISVNLKRLGTSANDTAVGRLYITNLVLNFNT